MPNDIVAFYSCQGISHFPGREDHIHEANEKIHLEDLRKSISIYASAIDELGKLTK